MRDFNARVDEAAQFLSTLFAGYTAGFAEIRAFRKEGESVVRRQDWKTIPLRSVKATAAELVRLSDISFDVYVGVLPREEKRGTADSVRQARWMWADFDSKNLAPGQLAALEQEGDMVVNSGHGVHVYWAIKPMTLTTLEQREVFCRTMRVIQKKGSDGQADNVADLPRILRVPGTWNWKRGEKVAVRLVRSPTAVVEDIPEVVSPIGDDESERIKQGVKAMITAAQENALPALYPAWRSCRGHIVNEPNVWVRGQLTWWQFMLAHQQRVRAIDDFDEAIRRGAIVDNLVVEMNEDFTNLFLRLDNAGYDPTNWQNSPLFTLEDIGGN